jgi:hypothetical protein
MSQLGPVSRVTPVHTAMRNCTGDEGRSFEVGNQVLISSHRKLLSSKDAMGPATRQVDRRFDQRSLTELPMQKPHDDSKACDAAFVQDSTLVVVIEMGLSSWLVAGMIPGVSREPLKKIDPKA